MPSLLRFMKGDVYSDDSCELQILGGPIRVDFRHYGAGPPVGYYYTFRWRECTDLAWVGKTGLIEASDLNVMNWQYNARHGRVVVAHCPECDEPDMIFYGEDYICAWCREHLEDE